jgi:alpha-N-arabinofuranosidase
MMRVRIVFTGLLAALILGGFGEAFPAEETREGPAVTIDAGRKGEPISKYIYGQFIEHLGKCIYDGIWAEMLADRKFYYPVAAEKSPWKIVGDRSAVKMRREQSFAGEQTPEVRVAWGGTPSGIMQGRLGLLKDKAYTGYIILARTGSPKIQVSLVWGPDPNDRRTVSIDKPTSEYSRTALSFTAGADTDDGRLEITGHGGGFFRIGTVSLMPADNVEGMRADTLALLKELNSPIYRWPGGNFVSGYNWRDGVGPRDKRPPRPNLAWNSLESNDFGIDEFMTFCRLIETEPLVVVNSGFGDHRSAAAQIEYVNGTLDTPMGKWRAANGHPAPYNVRWWGIGNEMYGNWQLGHMALNQYVLKHNQFADAMRRADPSIKLIAVGDAGPWSEGMMNRCAANMDLISEHFYCERDKESVVDYMREIPSNVRRKVAAHRDYRKRLGSLKGRDIRIAIDEWNYWRGSRHYNIKDALGVAAGLHEMIRNSDIVFMANYAQTVNVIGAIKTSKTAAAFDTTGLVLKMYRQSFGTIPVAVADVPEPIDIVAALSDDHKWLTVGIVNPTDREFGTPFRVEGASLGLGGGTEWTISDPDPMAHNEPGRKPNVVIRAMAFDDGMPQRLGVPAYSVTISQFVLAP